MPTPPHIELIARGFILHQSRVLMCRSIAGNYHYLPGGHIEFAEPASTALKRELLEETNTKITVGPLLLTTENTFNDGQSDHHEISLVFHVEQLAGHDLANSETVPEIISQESNIDFVWIDLAAAADLDIRPLQIKAWLLSGGAAESSGEGGGGGGGDGGGGGGGGIIPAAHLGGFEISIPPAPHRPAGGGPSGRDGGGDGDRGGD